MKGRFLSVPFKLLMLIFGALLLLSAGFSTVSLSRLNQEFTQYQQNILQQGQAQFALHSGISTEKLRLWLESFADVADVKKQDDFIRFKEEIIKQLDGLQLHYNVQNLWLFNAQQENLYASSQVPYHVEIGVNKVFERQMPLDFLHCEQSCEQYVFVPILNKKGETAVVAISISLVDIIYAINQTLDSEIALISYPAEISAMFYQAQIVSASNVPLMKQLFSDEHHVNDIESIKKYGLQVDLNAESYVINFLSLDESLGREYFLVLIDNVTAFKEKHSSYRSQFIFSAAIILITLAILVHFVANPFTKRLLTLSNVLPLLAKREFEKFRQIKIKRNSFFSDELDVLAEAATELSYELEQLNLEVEQKTKELENIAMYDLLTGLPNRNMLNYQLRKSLANIARTHGSVAVLFLDLDDFKKVNDSNGHSEGDRLLIEAANRIRLSIRNADVACRFGGDEFVVILPHVSSLDNAQAIADDILQRFKMPIKIGSSIFYVSTSIGIAYSSNTETKPEELISHADIAMYAAKNNSGGQYHVYHNEMFQRVSHKVLLEAEVRQALAKNQFSLSLQPQLAAKTKKLYGFEALLRWEHPERGMISPDDFIPILENSAYMIELGYWVIRRSFEIIKELHFRGVTDVRLAINLSAGQFMDINLSAKLKELLQEFGLSATCFELELTEQTLVKNIEYAITTMNSLKTLGFSFAIDDFGTGYSSLAYLKKMPVDVIKIDKSFVFGMLENHADYQIIMSTIAMVKNLGLTVIAEGVESSAQLRCLTENDCDLIQGYYFSKPIPEKQLFSFIEEQIVAGYWKTHA